MSRFGVGRGLVAGLLVGSVGIAAVNLVSAGTPGTASSFVPISPCRLADTRPTSTVGTRNTPIPANIPVTFAVWGANGQCTIPSTATAITANVTAVNPNANSYLTLYPADAATAPRASNLNWTPTSPPTPNSVTVTLSGLGAVNAFNYAGTIDVIIDIAGYYVPSSSGPAGPQGVQGVQGVAGAKGDTGTNGPVGPAGPGGIGVPGPANIGHASTTIDSTGNTGQHASITIGSDGFPVISYWDATNGDLRVAHCTNAACTSFDTPATVDSTGVTGLHTSITIGSDGFPVISYFDATNNGLRVAHCTNASCTTVGPPTTLDATGATGEYTSITIGTDGFPVISYYDVANAHLRVAHCTNAACTTFGTPTTVDSTGVTGLHTSITIGADGFPVISYHDLTSDDLRVAHCTNTACTTFDTPTTVDSTGVTGEFTSIAIGTDGFPVISYHDVTNDDLRVAHCTNAACTSFGPPTTIDATGSTGAYTSITIGADGLPVISYFDVTNGDLRVAHCTNPACTTFGTPTTIDANGSTGEYTSITIGADGFPAISYFDVTHGDLRVAHCTNTLCVPNTRRR